MKVYFQFNVLFPKSRIAGKIGNIDVECKDDKTKEELMNDDELKLAIHNYVQPTFKTGKIFGLEITDIK